jgi:hypothetical protein
MGRSNEYKFWLYLFFLTFFSVIVIPIFWITIIATRHVFDLISIIFLVLFGICLISSTLTIIVISSYLLSFFQNEDMVFDMCHILFIICFYIPNILQTLFIVLSWPINFYFVKVCVFILVLSLTGNMSYFTDDVPIRFLATSTTTTQCLIKSFGKQHTIELFTEQQISMREMHKIQNKIQTKIDEMQTKIDEMQKTMDEKKSINLDENV